MLQYGSFINNCLSPNHLSPSPSYTACYPTNRIYKSLCLSPLLIGKFYGQKVRSVYYFSRCHPKDGAETSNEKGDEGRALFRNREETKDVIFSIILGFTTIFTILLLDVLFNAIYEI